MKKKLLVTIVVLSSLKVTGQSSANVPARISSPRPVDDVALLLEHLYGKVITYEEPVRTWNGDVEVNPPQLDPKVKWALIPKHYDVAVPPETGIEPDVAPILQKIIATNNAQPIGPRFRLLTSKWGYHIVPFQSHDVNGGLVEVQSPLDLPVFVASESRTPLRHMQVLLAAIKSASGIFIDLGIFSQRGFDYEFSGRQSGTFEWGAAGISGRNALISLFQESATTGTWSLRCQSSALAEDRYCTLSIRKLAVSVIDPQGKPVLKVLQFDRCADCPAPGPLPPVKNR